MAGKYDVVIDTIPADGSRPEVLFRQAGDGFIQMEYFSTPRFDMVDSFRIQTIDKIVKENAPKGLIETVPALRTNLFHFDPEVCDRKGLIKVIQEAEASLEHVEDIEFSSRIISLPIAFEDSETRKAVEKYQKEVRPDAPNIINGYNIEYMALVQRLHGADRQGRRHQDGLVQQRQRLLAGRRLLLAARSPLRPRRAQVQPAAHVDA